jgi:hypothetical protein
MDLRFDVAVEAGLENLAPASQPTPPPVRYPGGVGYQ